MTHVLFVHQRVQTLTEPYWGTADGHPPPSTPECGFRDELCPPDYKSMYVCMYYYHYYIKVYL